jgi:predicted nucleotidyltransferase
VTATAPVRVVAARLGELRDRVVFVGGAIRGLLITDPGAAPERPTDDVDVVVEVTSAAGLYALGDELRAIGFREDTSPGAPICRWLVDGVKVDVMPTEGSVLGFRNRWYAEAMAHAGDVDVGDRRIRVIGAPHFCATKLEAFGDRGRGDLYHHDLEDVVAIVDGRAELRDELIAAPDGVRRFVASQLHSLLARDEFLAALPGHLPGDVASQGRLPVVLERLGAIAAIA